MNDSIFLIGVAIFGTLWAVVQFWLTHHFEQLKRRKESGAVFLAEVGQCLSKARYGTDCSVECVSFESYSNFIINLSFNKSRKFFGRSDCPVCNNRQQN